MFERDMWPLGEQIGGSYIGNPAKDVGVEANMVLADIESTLYQDFFLKSTTVIYFRFWSQQRMLFVSDECTGQTVLLAGSNPPTACDGDTNNDNNDNNDNHHLL